MINENNATVVQMCDYITRSKLGQVFTPRGVTNISTQRDVCQHTPWHILRVCLLFEIWLVLAALRVTQISISKRE